MRVLLEHRSEEWRAGRQDQLVGLDLSGSTAQGTVKKILFFSDLPESLTYIVLKVIPPQAELFTVIHDF